MSRLGRLWSESEGSNRANCDSSNQQFSHGTFLPSGHGRGFSNRLRHTTLLDFGHPSPRPLVYGYLLGIGRWGEFMGLKKEERDDQVGRCCCLHPSHRNVGTGNVARAASPAGRHGHASPRSMWRGYARSCRPWSLRDHTRPPSGPQGA